MAEKLLKDNVDNADHLEKAFAEVAGKWGVNIFCLDISKIKPVESVRLKCQVPLCPHYNTCKVCPPRIPSVAEFREALQSYRRAFLVVLQEPIENIDAYMEDFSAELKLLGVVSELERTAFQEGYYLALGLVVGGCKLCEECAPPGVPCRHPYKARPSPEGFGIDITELARGIGVPVEWPPKNTMNFMGLLLV